MVLLPLNVVVAAKLVRYLLLQQSTADGRERSAIQSLIEINLIVNAATQNNKSDNHK